MTRETDRPNILFILSDDHGYGDSSVYGGTNIQTPNIDRIAANGMRFTQFYANSPVCSPSRAALLTGRYPDMVGVPGVIRTHDENSWGYFEPRAITLPQKLQEAGYHTSLIGKWHLGLEDENHPCRRGFDHFHGFLGDMMDDYYTHLRHGNNYMREDGGTIEPEGHATDLFTSWAIEYIRDRAEDETPFFTYLAYNAPHTPIQPPDDWLAAVRKREPDISDTRARYVALVEHMDAGIGEVLDVLTETGMASNTLVVYASDNGGQVDAGACNAPWRGAKQDMYEGGIRIPCCAMWPGEIAHGTVSDQTAMLMDWFPTICELAGVSVDHEIDGQSIGPLLAGDSVDFENRAYYWVRREGGAWNGHLYYGQDYHALRMGDLKLLHNDAFSPAELYDIGRDPGETKDLVTSDDPTGSQRKLQVRMQNRVREAGGIPWRKHLP